uniref:TAP-C domain-containing protein n=1 Tax=Loa loa TaxID=7209 RepID=A0A1I7VDA2_LOALO
MSIADSIQSPAASVPQQLTPTERAAAGDQQMQQQMVEAFCQESRMKPEWSKKCLIDQNWNYEAAGQAFWLYVTGFRLKLSNSSCIKNFISENFGS